MAALNHVCMWQKTGWKRITASEAAALHPGGTVSAHSGLFMCELCGQYVLLTDGDTQVRHFRHSSSEKSKDCPERVFGSSVSIGYASGEHDLPLRIKITAPQGIDFEIGFLRVPEELLNHDLRVKIHSDDDRDIRFIYSRERFRESGITYLPVGNVPVSKYQIELINSKEGLHQFWPKTVPGVDRNGTIFDAETHLRLVYDSDVCLGKRYFLLKARQVFDRITGVSIREIVKFSIQYSTWHLYEVYAEELTEEAARFFLDYHCRLTEKPGALQVIWPTYIEEQKLIKYNDNSVMIYVTGYPTTRVFPTATIRNYEVPNGRVLEAFLNERQQLISAGRTKALEYVYFWKEPLQQSEDESQVNVVDAAGSSVIAGDTDDLPDGKSLCITVPFDGKAEVRSQGCIIDKRQLHAEQKCIIENITFGSEIRVYVGLDCVWKAAFIRKQNSANKSEELLLNRVRSAGGKEIVIPHSIAGIALSIRSYPLLRQWLFGCIRKGTMPEKAYKLLRTEMNNMKQKG